MPVFITRRAPRLTWAELGQQASPGPVLVPAPRALARGGEHERHSGVESLAERFMGFVRKEGQPCIVMWRNGPASGAGSFEMASQSVRSFARQASAGRLSARCSSTRCRNDTGRGAGGIQSSGRTPPPYSEYSGRIVLCRLRLGSLSGIFTSASAAREPSAAVTTL